VIPQLVEEWRKGADVVTAVRRTRAGEPRWRLAAIGTFYKLFARMASVSRSPNAGDFRLLDRSALRALAAMPERNRFLRGMTTWIGFRQAEVLYDRQAREAGQTKYPFFKLLRLAFDGVASFSRLPLQLAAYLGFFFAGLAFLGVPAAIGARLAGIYVPGIASLIMLVCFLGGLQLITLGVIGEYLGRIYDEVKHRPLYIVRERVRDGAAAEDA
jgi:dolichol-phosphate mannosyltransferase